MARSIAIIYNEIVADKNAQASISSLAPTMDTEQQLQADLNSSSKVAIWRLWAYVAAVAIYTHEVLWDLYKAELQAIASGAIVGTSPWYQAQVFAFQNGDPLVYEASTGRYKYAAIDTAKQIVKRCAIVEQADGTLAFKVAKISSGLPVALTAPEQTSLTGFLKKIRFAGTRFTLISGAGDLLKITATIYYDSVIPAATIKANVEAAIVAYVGGLPFNGEFLLSRLVDTIQAVTGVYDVVLVTAQTKQLLAGTYSSISRVNIPVYGYYQIDGSTGNTLSDTLTYIAQ
jgi:hypothetical protein